LGLRSTRSPDSGSLRLQAMFEPVLSVALWPWDDAPTVDELFQTARQRQSGIRVRSAQAQEGLGPVPAGGLRLDQQRWAIYRAELGLTAGLLSAMAVLSIIGNYRNVLLGGLIGFTVIELGVLSRHRPVDVAPIRPLTEQSAVLGRLAGLSGQPRTVDPTRNLPMVAGAAPVLGYRTLDVPILPALTRLAGILPADDRSTQAMLAAMNAVGARVRIIGPIARGADSLAPLLADSAVATAEITRINDPALVAWLFNQAYAQTPEGRNSRFVWLDRKAANRAWLLPDPEGKRLDRLQQSDGRPEVVLEILDEAQPIGLTRQSPEQVLVSGQTDGPTVLIVSQFADPEWRAERIGPGETTAQAPIVAVFGGWQGLKIPEAGRWTIRLEYQGRAAFWGLVATSGFGALWLVSLLLLSFGKREATPPSTQPGDQRLNVLKMD